MQSHNIVLTNKGFRIVSTDFSTNVICFFWIIFSVILHLFVNLNLIYFYLFSYIFFSIVFFIHRYKIGYIYPLSYFYQISIFLLLTPFIFINWLSIILTFLIVGFIILKQNLFRFFPFPLGLFITSIVVLISLLANQLGIKTFPNLFLQTYPSSTFFYGNPNLTGIYFPLFYSEYFLSIDTYSFFEIIGPYIFLSLPILFLRTDRFLKDISIMLLFLSALLINYMYDITYLYNSILYLSSLWFLLYISPGRNFSYISSFVAGIILLLVVLFYKYLFKFSSLPGIVIILCYYYMQSLYFLFFERKLKKYSIK